MILLGAFAVALYAYYKRTQSIQTSTLKVAMNEAQAKDATGYTNMPLPALLAVRAHQFYRPVGTLGSQVSTRGTRLPTWSGTTAAPQLLTDITVQTVIDANKRAIALGNDPTYDIPVPSPHFSYVSKVDPEATPRVGLSVKGYRNSTFDPKHNWSDPRVKGQW